MPGPPLPPEKGPWAGGGGSCGDSLMTPELKTTKPNLPVCPLIPLGLKMNPQADTVLALLLAPPGP